MGFGSLCIKQPPRLGSWRLLRKGYGGRHAKCLSEMGYGGLRMRWLPKGYEQPCIKFLPKRVMETSAPCSQPKQGPGGVPGEVPRCARKKVLVFNALRAALYQPCGTAADARAVFAASRNAYVEAGMRWLTRAPEISQITQCACNAWRALSPLATVATQWLYNGRTVAVQWPYSGRHNGRTVAVSKNIRNSVYYSRATAQGHIHPRISFLYNTFPKPYCLLTATVRPL